ncbi:DUF6807 domain-containing protein [Membranihabitans marinus]|uniref:DUF6807 domain-containing protein n=1 Tax=Membranihabitans marinus TaxID=1227546 RepID=UPI001F373A3A|nr:PmoA family protein [Membranihabitans marinus]
MIKRLFFSIGLACMAGMVFSCGSNGDQKSEEGSMSDTMTKDEVKLVANEAEKKVEVYMGDDLFTAYIYPDNIAKPVLYPIVTASGKSLTRGFPLDPMPGERVDHPHHVGIWLNYGDVNGLDFWNNSEAISAEKKSEYGTIYHKGIKKMEGNTLVVEAEWKDINGQVLLSEETTYKFDSEGDSRNIYRETKLTAQDKKVDFTDNKEGMLGIRVTRAMELPSDKPAVFTDAAGNPTEVKELNNDGVNGNYLSSEGIEGDDVWGTRGKWMELYSNIDGDPVSITVMDHPTNVGYPTYWHARGYGLFAANPLGQKAMSGGKEELNYSLDPGQSVTFRYNILVHSNSALSADQINAKYAEFVK